MGIATDLKNLGEEIIASYDMRIKAVGGLVKDTHSMLKGFHTEHKEMSAALRAELAKGEQSRLKDFKAMMSDIEKTLADLTKNVSNMIKGFQKDHKAMADELEAGLEQGETQRLKDFQKMMSDIQKDMKEIETFVANKLKEFDAAHADMSEELRKDLAKYVAGIVKETGQLIREYSSEMAQAKKAWSGMSATMAKARKAGFMMPKIDAGEKVTTVKQATRKAQGKKKTSPKSEGSKQEVGAGV
jgi:DNA-binding ferritin-like protein